MNPAAPEDFQHFSLSSLPHRQLAALADAGEMLSHQPDNLAQLELHMHDEPDVQQEENLINLCADIATLRKQWQRVIRAQQVTTQYQQHYPEGN